MRLPLLLLAISLFCLGAHGVGAARPRSELAGSVVAVVDGDTLRLASGAREIRVHVYGILAPVKNQEFGPQAARFLTDLVLGKDVTVVKQADGPYHSVVGEVFLGDRTNVGVAMVQNGLAWWDAREAPEYRSIRDSQEAARRRRAGLWIAANPESPSTRRRSNCVTPGSASGKDDRQK